MLKISDILKKTRKKRESKSSGSEEEKSVPELSEVIAKEKKSTLGNKAEMSGKKTDIEKRPASSAPFHDIKFENIENKQAAALYKEAISLAEQMRGISSSDWESFSLKAKDINNKFLSMLENDENALLRLFFNDYYVSHEYLYQHSVNVWLLSLYIAKSLKYTREQLQSIGVASLLHDIGLIQYDNLISQKKRFSKDEFKEIKQHPIEGRKIIEKINSNAGMEIIEVVSQEHERLDGSGYPMALEEKDINETARLVGLVDSYESMMHARPYRDKFKCEEVIKFFTQQKARFEHKFIKALIDLLGVFPVMTQVKLNTREVGIVIRQNYQMPLKPVVSITHSAQGQKIESPKAVDLALNFSIYIQEGLISKKIKDEKNSE